MVANKTFNVDVRKYDFWAILSQDSVELDCSLSTGKLNHSTNILVTILNPCVDCYCNTISETCSIFLLKAGIICCPICNNGASVSSSTSVLYNSAALLSFSSALYKPMRTWILFNVMPASFITLCCRGCYCCTGHPVKAPACTSTGTSSLLPALSRTVATNPNLP